MGLDVVAAGFEPSCRAFVVVTGSAELFALVVTVSSPCLFTDFVVVVAFSALADKSAVVSVVFAVVVVCSVWDSLFSVFFCRRSC